MSVDAHSYYAPKSFTNNTSQNNDYGFYSDSDNYVHGTGNKAINDTYDSYDVEVM